jgi:drug/metabolite transporter (DMT)-like permease
MPQLVLLLSTLIWGATFPATKAALEQVSTLSFLFIRFLVGAGLALAIVLMVSGRLGFERDLLRRAGVATVWLFLGYITQTLGLESTTASNSAFITTFYVVLVPLFMLRFDWQTWSAAGLAVGGLWFLINPAQSINIGDLWTLACAAAFAAHIACLERYTREGDVWSLFVWQMVLVTILFGLTVLWEPKPLAGLGPTPVLLTAFVVTGVLATGAFAVQIWVQQHLPAQKVALIFALEPVYAAWLAWYFLGEQLGLRGWIGSALVLTAVVLGSVAFPLVKAAAAGEPAKS